jgi:hypothetical protein
MDVASAIEFRSTLPSALRRCRSGASPARFVRASTSWVAGLTTSPWLTDNNHAPNATLRQSVMELQYSLPHRASTSAPGLRIGRVFGIPIYAHPSWFVIFALITFSLATQFTHQHPRWPHAQHWSLGILPSFLFFGSVLFHDLAHATVAALCFGGASSMRACRGHDRYVTFISTEFSP